MTAGRIIRAALEARTLEQAEEVNRMIEAEIGAAHRRPLGDRPNNFGLVTQGGSFDTKIIENVTNMQDAVLERAALARFGDKSRVPFQTPREAADALFAGRNYQSLADDAVVEFYESDPPARTSRRLTAVFRDHGCGLAAAAMPETIFALGSDHKDDAYWLQGAFGLGGETTFRNARAVVLVSRRPPELLNGAEDRIAVAVLVWEKHGKGISAYYLVTSPWTRPGDAAEPFSAPAGEHPDFEPGTHLALISYGVEGYHRYRLGDEKSFDTVLNTRLFDPITPVRFTNHILGRDRADYLRGLAQRLEDNPRPDRREGRELLPYNIEGTTYHLPVRYHVFAKRGELGERRKFVAHDHAVVFTSNGQTHYHWTPLDFKSKTTLRKLQDRIFVVVEMDELPIEIRTSFFTADRSTLVRNDPAIQLEQQVAAFLDEWEELREINNQILLETIAGSGDPRSTLDIAKKIGRALQVRGFQQIPTGGTAGGRGRGRVSIPVRVVECYPDPTTLEGPEHVFAEAGKTRFITFILNAVDGFIPRRGQLEVSCDHPEIGGREITVGPLRSGRVRISIAIPAGVDLGVYRLEVVLRDWVRAAGGLGTTLSWTTKVEVVETRTPRNGGGNTGKGGTGEGPLVAVVWKRIEEEPEWNAKTVGDVDLVPASILAQRPDYQELAPLGEQEIPTLELNEEFHVLKDYAGGRARELSEEGIERLRNRYAVGVGVGMLLLHQEVEKRQGEGETVSDEWIRNSHAAVARGVISIMPDFDTLAREAGLEE
jgi:hypothetical protein